MITRNRVIRALMISAVIVFFIFLLRDFDFALLKQSFLALPGHVWVILLSIQLVSQFLVYYQWRLSAQCVGACLSHRQMLRIQTQGVVVDSVTPGVKIGGEVSRIWGFCKVGALDRDAAVSILVIQKTLSMTAFFALSMIALLFLSNWLDGALRVFALFTVFILLSLVILVFVLIFFKSDQVLLGLEKHIPRNKILDKLRCFFVRHLIYLSAHKKSRVFIFGQLGLAFLIWLLYALKAGVLMGIAFPEYYSLPMIFVPYVAYVLAMIPAAPGGLGTFEASFAAGMLALGLHLEGALIAAFVFRFVTFWFVLILSAIVYLGVSHKPNIFWRRHVNTQV